MKIGAHVSTAGGLDKAIENAQKIGASCIQIFGSSPRQWKTNFPSLNSVQLFKKRQRESGISPVFLHASYLVNLSSDNEFSRNASIRNLSDHLKIADMIGAQGLIFHIGSKNGIDEMTAHTRTAEGMKQILQKVSGNTQLIMENAASRKRVGATASELGKIYRMIASERVKICIDTAHAIEAGIIESYAKDAVCTFLNEWDKEMGLENVVALHVNDSKTPCNSQHDRHENIGEGCIGIEGFTNLAKDTRLWDKAWILEVPGFDGTGPDKKNVEVLHSLFTV